MSLSRLNNSVCLRATWRQDIPTQNLAVLPQIGLSRQASAEARRPSLFPWGYGFLA